MTFDEKAEQFFAESEIVERNFDSLMAYISGLDDMLDAALNVIRTRLEMTAKLNQTIHPENNRYIDINQEVEKFRAAIKAAL